MGEETHQVREAHSAQGLFESQQPLAMEAELCGGPVFWLALLQVPVGDQHRVKLASESATQGPSHWALPVPAQTALSHDKRAIREGKKQPSAPGALGPGFT